jgi:hypothetical protein
VNPVNVQARKNLNAPKLPYDVVNLLALQHQANSRFLTDCYLFLAALWSARGRKIVRLQSVSAAPNKKSAPAPISATERIWLIYL